MGKSNVERRKITSRKRLRGNVSNLRRGLYCTANQSISQIAITNNKSQEAGRSVGMVEAGSTAETYEEVYQRILLKGRRIVDLQYFLEQLQTLSEHGVTFGCTLRNLFPYKQSTKGLQSTIHYHCMMCNGNFKLFTSEKNVSSVDVNTAAVIAGIAIGIGFCNTEELFATLDIPFMSLRTYSKCTKEVNAAWRKTALLKMQDAARKEMDYAKRTGSVNENGVPLITVVADGCWSKRSYRSNYSALSGAACIIGQYSGQVLYLGVKNKYCLVCARAENANKDPKHHVCFKNYYGTSSGMESAALVQGFKESESTHGLIYNRLIADGDSSTYKKILDSRPYDKTTVEKIECRNHILRNYCSKLRMISQDTRFPLNLRKLTASNILRLRTAITSAIKFRKNEDSPEKIELLKLDIQNSVNHVFGQHEDCKDYYCKRKHEQENYLPEIKNCEEFYMRLQQCLRSVWLNSNSLINNFDSNIVEQFNSIIAKHIGGKRVNFSLKDSYQARCDAAVVRFNTKRPLCELYKTICGTDATEMLTNFEIKRQRKIERAAQRLIRTTVRTRRGLPKTVKKSDFDYGENCQKPDMPENIFQAEKHKFIDSLRKSTIQRITLEKDTILQAGSGKWLEERRKLLTASIFHKVCIRRPTTSCKNLVKHLLYNSKILNVPSVKHGKDNENRAIKQLEVQENVKIEACGLFVDPKFCYLGASPDGLVNDNLVVEIKCPSSSYNMCPDEAIKLKKIKFWLYEKKTDSFKINTNNEWYYQIQGQMQVTNRKGCLFAVWTGENFPLKVAYINRRRNFWERNMEPKLTQFYFDCVLPELIDPRHTRNMDIREPCYIVQAQKQNIRKRKNNQI